MARLLRNCLQLSTVKKQFNRRFSVNILSAIFNPDRAKNIAVVDSTGQQHTYSEICMAASRLSANIKTYMQHGSGKRPRCAVASYHHGSANYVITALAAWMAGASVVPLSTAHSSRELLYYIEDSGADCVLYSPDLRDKLPDLSIPTIEMQSPFEGAHTDINYANFQHACDHISADAAALIVYTSGTTGKPKGVVHSHEGLQHMVTSLVCAWEYTSADHILHFLPLHHVHGIVNKLWCVLYAGGTVEFMPSADAKGVWERLAGYTEVIKASSPSPPTLFMAVPTVYAKMLQLVNDKVIDPRILQAALKNISQMRVMISGSAALPTPLLHSWKALTGHVLLERYGMTEIGMALSNPLHGERREGYVGRPLPFVECKIVPSEDDDGNTGVGELRIKGPTVFKSYLNRPEETVAAFDDAGWFKTGDVASIDRVNGQDEYRILGRNSTDIIKSAGFKISALEIERELLSNDKILEVAVIGINDPTYGEVIAAVIVPSSATKISGSTISTEDVRHYLKDKLAAYKHPRIVRVVDCIPRNQLGKVNKKTLWKDIN